MAEEVDYWNALDKRGVVNPEKLDVNPNRVGISHGIGDVGEGLKANVFRGATVVELGFMGRGKGYRSQPTGATPESFGANEREDIRQLARINEVELSTHAAPDLGRVSGISDDNQSFNDSARQNALHEIQRAVGFAADTAEGGAVVVHLGEFPRAIFEADDKFEAHPGEEEKAPSYLVDERTGQVQGLRRDMEVSVPIPKLDKKGKQETDKFGAVFERNEDDTIKFKKKTYADFANENKEKGNGTSDAQYFYKEYFQKQLDQQKGEQLRWTHHAEEQKKQLKDLNSFKEAYDKSYNASKDKKGAEKLLLRIMQDRNLIPRALATGKGLPEDEDTEKYLEHPVEFLNDRIKDSKREFDFANDIAMSAGRSLHELEENVDKLKPIEEYGVKKSADTLARAAMHAFKIEKARGFDKPLFISPENWNPESYGNHPKEYKRVIIESRTAMKDMLVKTGYGKQEAQKIADDHIQGTFDVGHLNFWRKYFKEDPKDSPEQTDKKFKSWIDKQAKMLAKEGIIGNVHLSDNFGFHDEHLSPGEGNAPIERFVRRLEDKGYTGKYIGEPGGQKEGFLHTAWTGTLSTLNSPVYRADGQTAGWSDVEHAYFGNAPQSPNFLVGDAVPSKDWSLWSETPLE